MTAFERPPTAQEAVLAELRRAIASGRLRPGQQVLQDALAEQLGRLAGAVAGGAEDPRG